MPGESYVLELYWGGRKEDERSCAKRLASMAQGLAQFDSDFDRWLKQGLRRPKYKPLFAMPPDLEELVRLFHKNREYYDDPPDKLWPQMGFWISAWNGREDDFASSILVHAGAYDLHPGPPPNHVSVRLPRRSGTTQAPWTAGQIERILRVAVDAWEPKYAAVTSDRINRLLPHAPNYKAIWPMTGWITYLCMPYSLCVNPSSDIAVERFPDRSMIATLCEEPFDSDDPRCQKLLADMNEALGPAQKIWKWDEA